MRPRHRGLTAFVGYMCVAVAFVWPLPLHLGSALLGPVGSDAGVYIWNLWVFRHELIAHHAFPFFTRDILSLTPPASLALHNYTAVANVLALPLLPLLGTVATFNLLMIVSTVVSAYAVFLLARRSVRDSGAAWVAGLAFGFAPFMSAPPPRRYGSNSPSASGWRLPTADWVRVGDCRQRASSTCRAIPLSLPRTICPLGAS